MKFNILYPSAPVLSPVCLGSSTFGREIDETAAFALMDHAVARNLTLIDTAATYSAGRSEQIVGAWLTSRRPDPRRLTVATKIYPPYTPEAIDIAVAASAQRLGVAVIDVLYLHKWDPGAETPAAWQALDRLVKSGRVRALGVSNFTTPQLRAALALQREHGLQPLRVLQNNNNLAVRDVDAPMVELCASHQVAIITYSPLGGGFLTGKHRGGVEPGSRFDVAPGHQGVYFHPLQERRLARLAAVSARTGLAMPHLALAWALHRPGVASTLVGGRGPQHLEQALAAWQLNDSELFAELETDPGEGPS
jgi:aryl-alcohol dehydrogenase-like predicted oxidoreductase